MDIWCSCVLYLLWRGYRLVYAVCTCRNTVMWWKKLSPCTSLTMLDETFIFMALKLKFLRRKLLECMGLCESNASYFIFHVVYNLLMWKFHSSSPQRCWRHSYLSSCSVRSCGQCSSMFEQEHIFLPSRSYSLFLQPLAHNILQSNVVCIMMSSWTLSCNRPNRCNMRTVQVRGVTTVSNQTSWLSPCCTLLCVCVVNSDCCFETLSSLNAK